MFRHKIVGYVSEIDKFLAEFDRTHTKSEAQLAEIVKYHRIYAMRENPEFEEQDDII